MFVHDDDDGQEESIINSDEDEGQQIQFHSIYTIITTTNANSE
jgi:hypothetical protein